MLAVGVTVLAIGVTIRVADLRIATVVSNSMKPTFSAGDVVVTQSVPTSSIRAGDVIEFVPPDGGLPVIHRITSMQDGVVTTRGDANSADDPWRAIIASPTTNRLFAVVPFVGWLTQLELPVLLLAALFGALAIVFALSKEVIVRRIRSRPQPQS